MVWYAWVVVALYAWTIGWSIDQIGKPREPYTSRLVTISTIINLLLIWATVALATH